MFVLIGLHFSDLEPVQREFKSEATQPWGKLGIMPVNRLHVPQGAEIIGPGVLEGKTPY